MGIGRATAIRHASEDARVVCADISAEGAAATAADLDGTGHQGLVLDGANAASCCEMIATALASHGKLDMLCNNAGVMDWGPSYELDAAETKLLGYRRNHIQAAVNEIVAQFRPSEITGKHDHSKKSERRAMMMKMLSGQTAFVTGGSGDIGVANKPAYTASKHDVIGLTHASTLQLGSTISPQPYCGSRRTIRHSSLAMILRSTEGWSRNSLASGVDSAPH